MKVVKWVAGLLLWPSCVAATLALYELMRLWQPAGETLWTANGIGLAGGAVLWVVLYLAMPRPTRAYVLGHELTHLLWAWLLGIRASRVRITSKGGSVAVERHHFLVTLAPYFFPLYTVLVILLHLVISAFHDTSTYEPFWLGCIGLTWAFHLTFTLSALKENQPDIRQEGYVFSFSLIYLLNVLGILLWVVLVSHPSMEIGVRVLSEAHAGVYQSVSAWGQAGWRYVAAWIGEAR